jgi:hypothetical protein
MRPSFLYLIFFTPLATYGQGLTYGWDSTSDTDLFIEDSAVHNAVKTGDLGGLLSNTHARANGSATASAAYKAVGDGYTFGADIEATATGSIEVDGITHFSTSSVVVTSGWKDKFHLVGSGQLPAGSLNLNFGMEGTFHSNLDQSQDISQSVMTVEVEDRVTGQSYGRVEYQQEWNGFNQTLTTSGPSSVSALLSITKLLGSDKSASYQARIRTEGFMTGGRLELVFGHTVRLQSITFPDGSTPESHGFEIVFDSGLMSPNLLSQQIAGDYNGNGTVEAADYVVWRNGDSPDDTQAGYNLWKANFGKTAGTGSSIATIPEPSTLLLTIAALGALNNRRRRAA